MDPVHPERAGVKSVRWSSYTVFPSFETGLTMGKQVDPAGPGPAATALAKASARGVSWACV